MEFDKSRCYSALNADELRAGDKVIVSDCLRFLRQDVKEGGDIETLKEVLDESHLQRFKVMDDLEWGLAYLVERKENCTNCKEGRWDAEHKKILCDPVNCGNGNVIFRNHEIEVCEYYKPITKKRAEEKNCYNCRLNYTRDGVMRCMMNDHRCNNPEVACNHYEPTTFEKHYRPFRDTDELIKVWGEKIKDFCDEIPPIVMPLIWMRYKESNNRYLITAFFEENNGDSEVFIGQYSYSMKQLFNEWEFLDGSPCGVEA